MTAVGRIETGFSVVAVGWGFASISEASGPGVIGNSEFVLRGLQAGMKNAIPAKISHPTCLPARFLEGLMG